MSLDLGAGRTGDTYFANSTKIPVILVWFGDGPQASTVWLPQLSQLCREPVMRHRQAITPQSVIIYIVWLITVKFYKITKPYHNRPRGQVKINSEILRSFIFYYFLLFLLNNIQTNIKMREMVTQFRGRFSKQKSYGIAKTGHKSYSAWESTQNIPTYLCTLAFTTLLTNSRLKFLKNCPQNQIKWIPGSWLHDSLTLPLRAANVLYDFVRVCESKERKKHWLVHYFWKH